MSPVLLFREGKSPEPWMEVMIRVGVCEELYGALPSSRSIFCAKISRSPTIRTLLLGHLLFDSTNSDRRTSSSRIFSLPTISRKKDGHTQQMNKKENKNKNSGGWRRREKGTCVWYSIRWAGRTPRPPIFCGFISCLDVAPGAQRTAHVCL